jgi:flagellar hook-associated protein 3 FlgL
MIGRITPLMTSAQILSEINQAQDQMDTTEEQLSTGKTINQPSDNPYGASLAVSLNSDLAGLTNYSNNVSDGTAAASALTNMQDMVQRAQELAVESANGTQSSADLAATGAEITQLTDQIQQEANTQYNGQYVFAGTSTGTPPYSTSTGDAYQGNTGVITRQIGPGSAVQVNVDISQLLGDGQSAGDGKLLDTLRTMASDMTGGTSADVADLSNQVTNLQSNFSTLEQMQTTVGATQDRLTLAASRIQNLQNSDTAALSNDEDANMASTMTTFSNQQAAFTAALRAGANIVQSSLMDFLSTS